MKKIIDFVEYKLFGNDKFTLSFSSSLILTIVFITLDFCSGSSNGVFSIVRTILTYLIPSFNILYLTYIIYKFEKDELLKMIVLILLSVSFYLIYLKNANSTIALIICIPGFVFYTVFMNSWITQKNKNSNDYVYNETSKVSG